MFLTKTLRLRSCDFEPDLLSDGYFDIFWHSCKSCDAMHLWWVARTSSSSSFPLCKALVALQRSARKVQNSEDSLKAIESSFECLFDASNWNQPLEMFWLVLTGPQRLLAH
jgi:hypothetical protein